MTKKGNKVWWKCSRYNIHVCNTMCEMSCLPEECEVCLDREDKPDRSEAPIAESLEKRLNRHIQRQKKKEDGFDKIRKRAKRKRVI